MKKLLAVFSLFTLLFVLAGCEILSTIAAVTGFASEYQQFKDVYNSATYFEVSTDLNFTVNSSDDAALVSQGVEFVLKFDDDSNTTYLEMTQDGVTTKDLYMPSDNGTIDYVIDGNVVTPTFPESSDVNEDIKCDDVLNVDGLNIDNIADENKVGDVYSFTILLADIVDLDKFAECVGNLEILNNDTVSFDNARASVTVVFLHDEANTIEFTVALNDYTIDLGDGAEANVSITGDFTVAVPAESDFPDVLGGDYQFVAVEDKALATKVYVADNEIVYPVTANEGGWIQIYLEAGTYDLISANTGYFSAESALYDAAGNVVNLDAVSSYQYTITTAGTYYYHLVPTTSFTCDLEFRTQG